MPAVLSTIRAFSPDILNLPIQMALMVLPSVLEVVLYKHIQLVLCYSKPNLFDIGNRDSMLKNGCLEYA